MFEIDLTAQDDGVWFDFLESKYDQEKDEWVFAKPASFESGAGPQLKIRDPLPCVRKQLERRGTVEKLVRNPKTNKMEIISKIREPNQKERQAEEDELNLYMLPEFSGFQDMAKKVIECNEKTRLAMAVHPAIDRFIGRAIKILRGIEVEKAEEEKKTS